MPDAFLALSAASLILLTATWRFKAVSQENYDSDRQVFRLQFPSHLTAEQITAWLSAVSGSLSPGLFGLNGVPTMALEMMASDRGIDYRIRVPEGDGDYIASQLRTLIPGTKVTPEDAARVFNWSRVVEIAESAPNRLLSIPNPVSLATSLLASVQALRTGEILMTQWVVTTARPKPLPKAETSAGKSSNFGVRLFSPAQPNKDEIAELRTKFGQINFNAVLRIGAKARSEERAEHLISRIRTALSGTSNANNHFRTRPRTQAQLVEGINKARSPMVFPINLTALELASLLAWPIGNPHVAGLSSGHTRQLPPSGTVPRSGRVVAFSNFPGHERPLAMTAEAGLKHLHVIGPTGVGKTTLLTNLVAQDIEAGHGVIVIEGKGDLFYRAMTAVPRERLEDVIVLDVTDEDWPVGFNILDQGKPRAVVEQIGSLFEYLYRDSRSVWTREVLYHALSTLVSKPGHTFVDLTSLLYPRSPAQERWRQHLLAGLKDPELKQFWARFNSLQRPQQERFVQPVLDRIWQLNARPEIRNIIGQTSSSFSMREVIEGNKILLVNLAGLGQETASLSGTLLINALWQAVKRGGAKRPNYLYVDEFQDFLQLPISPESMLAQARGFGLGMVLAHQHLEQLTSEMRAAVMANARSKVVFQTSHNDAGMFAREFGGSVTPEDFMNLGAFEVITRLVTGEGVSSPMTGRTPQPLSPWGFEREVRKYSRKKYGRPHEDVVMEIANRTSIEEEKPAKRAKLGGQDWKP